MSPTYNREAMDTEQTCTTLQMAVLSFQNLCPIYLLSAMKYVQTQLYKNHHRYRKNYLKDSIGREHYKFQQTCATIPEVW